MDMSELFRRHLANLHKGTNLTNKVQVQNRKEDLIKARKSKRDTLAFARRNIDANMSPFSTPIAPKTKPEKDKAEVKKEPPKSTSDGVRERLEMLAKWKAEKEKQKQLEKATKKPIFKVCHVPAELTVNLENVNKVIKGKSIMSSVTKKSQFAPANHKFRPPDGIKPINLNNNQNIENKVTVTENPKHSKTKSKNVVPKPGSSKQLPKRTVCRYEKDNDNPKQASELNQKQVRNKADDHKIRLANNESHNKLTVKNEIKAKGPKSSVAAVTKTTAAGEKKAEKEVVLNSSKIIANRPLKKRILVKEENKSLSEMPVDLTVKKDSDTKGEPASGDISKEVKSPIYVSPFVTISRGKAKARDEFKMRRSYGINSCNPITPEAAQFINAYTSPQAGAEYFLVKLESETNRINKVCEKWESFLLDPELPEEAQSSIDVAIGQSKLLIAKKFEQFRGLIVQCKMKCYKEKVITCEDLHGFWDMVYMQVEDLDKRFADLDKLRENNWIEIVHEKKMNIRKNMPRVKKVVATSRLKDMIKAARRKQKTERNPEDESLFNENKTPLKEVPQNPALLTSAQGKSLRVSTLNAVSSKKYSSSPGLTMMKVSQSIKQGNGLTPAKSILKPKGCMSTGKKSVVFMESSSPKNLRKTVLFSDEDKGRARRSLNFHREEKENTPLRRSARLSKCV